ncbi:MAG TPA: glycosyltransferase [Patescibacteria group bacterium]|nr:glycosyltransferase [Patescibacteria group bacterium]
MKIALVHDYLGEFGGAERVLLALSDMYPDAPIYTAFTRPGPAMDRFAGKDIRVSWAQQIPFFATKFHSPLRFLAPLIWNSFDFSGYDVIIGSASWYITKGFLKVGPSKDSGRPKTVEICYCHTPPRWLYGYATSKQSKLAKIYGTIVGFFMRQYDFRAAQRVDYFIANSEETRRRIQKFYRRDATVIYPPVDISTKHPLDYARGRQAPSTKKRLYYLVVSRLAQPKNVELAIRVANKMKLPLKIAGTGPDEVRLKDLAGPTVELLGFVPEGDLPQLYRDAKAFLALSGDEDFGMTPVEALSFGTPVIAFRGGGYTESVIEEKTGMFFESLTVESLVRAIRAFESRRHTPETCRNQAEKFSKARFEKVISAFIKAHVRVP